MDFKEDWGRFGLGSRDWGRDYLWGLLNKVKEYVSP
jgi:hypothetical protein